MKIIFIAPVFYGYHTEIIELLKQKYDKVLFFNEVPFGNQTRYKYLIKVFGFLKKWLWRSYSDKILKTIEKENVETVYIIRGEELPEALLQGIKRIDTNIKIINYQWDSVRNNPNALIISKYADINYTFDMEDSVTYNKYRHLPLFYNWKNPISNNCVKKYDILFFGSYSKERFDIVSKLLSLLDEQSLTHRVFIYIPLISLIKRLLTGCSIPLKYCSIIPMQKNKYQRLVEKSRCLFDLPSPTQNGATMRTIEAMSMQCKLLTTNKYLINEKFYNKKNIMFWPINNPLELKKFLSTPFDNNKISNILSLEEWLKVQKIL